jgi:hypothetical protein
VLVSGEREFLMNSPRACGRAVLAGLRIRGLPHKLRGGSRLEKEKRGQGEAKRWLVLGSAEHGAYSIASGEKQFLISIVTAEIACKPQRSKPLSLP